MDDILVYSKTHEEHAKHLRTMLQILKERQLYTKISKCELWMKQVNFLGQMILQSERCEANFQELKRRLVFTPILILLGPIRKFYIYCDTLGQRLGCILQGKKVVSYALRKLRPRVLNYATHDLKLVILICGDTTCMKQDFKYYLGKVNYYLGKVNVVVGDEINSEFKNLNLAMKTRPKSLSLRMLRITGEFLEQIKEAQELDQFL
ncbi:Tf2-6, partial [Mucuna pruriens]